MPRIFDNIDQSLLPALTQTLLVSERADFCVGYFNLRGWKQIDRHIEKWAGGEGHACRLLVGMHQSPDRSLREKLSAAYSQEAIDNAKVIELKQALADEFRTQLTLGVPNNADEAGLRKLARQIRARKVIVKLFLRHPLHAKLYLLHRPDPVNPKVGFVGSSNLTFAGLSMQGELNVDVMDHDACQKLSDWFDARWGDRWCIDISDELAAIIEQSWAGAKEVLRLLIRNSAPVVYVLARSIKGWRKPRAIADSMSRGNVAAVSPFEAKQTRTTAKTAAIRNDFIVSKADQVLIAHASNPGKTEALARSVINQGKSLLTFPSASNAHLIEMGAVNV